jgi:hypothetical protein
MKLVLPICMLLLSLAGIYQAYQIRALQQQVTEMQNIMAVED